jgi:arabinofuranan 3-O-arabinosyltransferase
MHPVDTGSALPATPDRPAIPDRPEAADSGVRVGVVALYVVIAAMSLLQQPGQVTYDTRAELTQRPGGFLAEAFTLWHPESNFGEFQNQAYGYLFPQGSFFVLADLVQLPDWVGQRLWSALVLVVACEGARRVAVALGMTAPVALLAGLAFAFSPRLLGTVSVITGESLPGAVLPWVLLPVLLALQGRLPGWRAVVLSGAAVVCMGGVNAVENLGALPLVAVVVAWGWRRGLLSGRLAGAWAGTVLLASAWWLLPLLVLAGYAPPFYEYVESAANTTALVGWSEATRGGSHWVAYLIVGDQAWWPAANDLVSSPGLVVVSAVVSGLGLWGLARFAHPLRRPLVLAALIGLGALTVAHGGWEGSPVSGQVRALLDGPLQVFRNVHKIDPTVRLPLAIGFAHAVALLLAAVVRRRPRWEAATGLLYVVPLALVVSLGQPYLVNNSRTPGWEEISQPWQQAEAYLAEHQDDRTTLVLPGSGFAHQTWGWTLDEPLQVLGGANRATRSQVPIIPGQSIRFLTALDQLASTGRADDDLADQLARAGIGHVVIRRDLLRSLTGSPFPGGASVSAAVGGLVPVAGYGGLREGGFEVEVYEVPVTAPVLRTTPLDDVLTVRGAPESILALQRQGLVDVGQATVLEGEPAWDGTAQVVTDADQRRERAFGVSDESVSAVMGADEPYRTDRAVHEFPTVAGARQVVARYDGLRSLTASSSQGYADNFGPVVPQAAPYAAVDGDPETRWVTSSATRPEEQWLRLVLDEPLAVSQVEVLPVVDDPSVTPIRTLEVRAGDQVRTVAASPSGAVSTAAFDGSPVTSVEVRVLSAASGDTPARVGLREVTVDGLTPTRSLVVPGAGGPGTSWLFSTTPERRACALTVGAPDCEDRRIRSAEEPQGMDRTFASGPAEQRVEVRGTVVARATREAALLLDPVRRRQVGATSIYGNDPRVSQRFAYDGEESTVWVSADEDRGPTLFLDFGRRRTVSGLEVRTGEAGSAPVSAIVRSGDDARAVDVVEGELGRFRPLEGRAFRVTFEVAPDAQRVAIAELELQGARLTRPFVGLEPTGAVCGLGPRVVIDGTPVPTRVSGTLADVVNGTPMTFESCVPDTRRPGGQDSPDRPSDTGSVALEAGGHRLTTVPTREFLVTEVAVVPEEPLPTTGSSGSDASDVRGTEVRTWGSSRRVADVEAGPASLLHLPENFNEGWVAEVDGEPLEALRVDGWQQGWVLPAGPAVEVTMTYRPQQLYAVVLPLGLAASGSLLLAGLVLLVLGAVRRLRHGRAPDDPAWGAEPPAPGVLVGLVLAPLALLVLGWAAVVGLLVGLLVSAPRRVPYAAALVVVAAVLDVQVSAAWSRSWGDALAAVGVGVLVGTVLVEPHRPGLPRLPRRPRLPRLLRLGRRGAAS